MVVPVGGSTGGSGYEQTALITGTATFTSYGSGACMVGWVSCSASIGGGCCPGGFGCGASCTADNGAGTSVVPKIAPNGVGSRYAGYFGWSFMAFGLVAGLGMVLL